MADSGRTMIVLDVATDRFQVRAGAVIRSGAHVLIHRATRDPFWALPGGRVELHESARQALEREICEEIGVGSQVAELRVIIENFFQLDGRRVHEIGFYHEVRLLKELPFHDSDIVHRVRDGDDDLEFRWVEPSADNLELVDFRPVPLRSLLSNWPASITHLVHRD